MLTALYNLIIMPIQLIVEMTYSIMARFLGNKGLAIIAVSLVIQTLVLPLYKRSDALQEEERKKQESMSHWVKHIKKTFKGDERFMMLSTYYKQQNYKTVYALKSSFSILLQIPFFVAAYNYLSNLEELRGVSFTFIRDLGRPDQMFSIGGFAINVLPILMTIFNIISGIIYTKGLPVKSKVQVYGLAAVFLVLLYNSPSGLVLYWTMNNLYSLLKNVFMKLLKHPMEVLGGVVAVAGLGILGYLAKLNGITKLRMAFVLLMVIICQMPWILKHYKARHAAFIEKLTAKLSSKDVAKNFFIWEMVLFALFMGYFIPSTVIASSTTEFIVDGLNPMTLVWRNLSIYAGIFIVWFSIFYYLMTDEIKRIFANVTFAVFGVAFFNYMKHSGGHGVMSAILVYEETPIFTRMDKLLNLAFVLVLFVVLMIVAMKKSKLAKSVVQILVLGIIVFCVKDTIDINSQMKDYNKSRESLAGDNTIKLSTEGQNVIVFMLDRAIGTYVPYIMQEKPELMASFDGFTYYPNTMSFASYTNMTTPSLFGGYEYTPVEINKRSDELLQEKHDEAFQVMPAIFNKEGYNVVICDPVYTGYQYDPDLSIYDKYEHVNAYISKGAYNYKAKNYTSHSVRKRQENNFVYYGMVKILPIAVQNIFYYEGNYFCNSNDSSYENKDEFLRWYTTLISLNEMTEIVDDDSDNFLMFQNAATHEPIILKTPEYIPSDDVNVAEALATNPTRIVDGHDMYVYDERSLAHYHVNVASLEAFAVWLDYLKEMGVYDNTRILLVSDHGYMLSQFDYMRLPNGVDVEFFNPVLMVKDFNATGYTVSNEFMTSADVPTIATSGVIENPVNPFTGKNINNDEKYAHPQVLTTSMHYSIRTNNGYTFDTSDGEWFEVKDNIFNPDNWTKIEE